MTDNKGKALNQDVELDLEKVGDKVVGGAFQRGIGINDTDAYFELNGSDKLAIRIIDKS